MPTLQGKSYSSKIIKASALLTDTKTLLAQWDESKTVAENMFTFRQENLFGKTSRSRVEDILAIFKQRYLSDPGILHALLTFVKAGMSAETLDRILYFLTLRSDPLLHDAVTEMLVPLAARGLHEVPTTLVDNWVRAQVAVGKTERAWGEETATRVAQGIMSTLRDFGILQGAVNKRLSLPYLPIGAFSFIVFLLARENASGERLLNHPDWAIFFLNTVAVERLFLEAHQERLLSYHAAGPVIRIEFPMQSIEEYANVIAQKPH